MPANVKKQRQTRGHQRHHGAEKSRVDSRCRGLAACIDQDEVARLNRVAAAARQAREVSRG